MSEKDAGQVASSQEPGAGQDGRCIGCGGELVTKRDMEAVFGQLIKRRDKAVRIILDLWGQRDERNAFLQRALLANAHVAAERNRLLDDVMSLENTRRHERPRLEKAERDCRTLREAMLIVKALLDRHGRIEASWSNPDDYKDTRSVEQVLSEALAEVKP